MEQSKLIQVEEMLFEAASALSKKNANDHGIEFALNKVEVLAVALSILRGDSNLLEKSTIQLNG